MTRREKLEARVERRRQWAAAREHQGAQAQQRVHDIADRIPFGQPILVGHHSERGARADQRHIENGMRAAVDNWQMAKHHEEKAEGLERQLRTTIFSDDEDAVAQLEAKIAQLEAKRENAKAQNAAYRKAHAAELKAMNAYQRSTSVPFPSYSLTSYGAEIRRCRERIADITRNEAAKAAGVRTGGRVMASKYGGTCPDCGNDFQRGEMITWFRSTREAVHVDCEAAAKREP